MIRLSGHTLDRLADRLTVEERTAVAERIGRVAAALPGGDVALRVLTLAGQRNAAWSNVSNGDTVWAIVRGGTVATVMLRRSTQPTTPAAFGVDRVLYFKEN